MAKIFTNNYSERGTFVGHLCLGTGAKAQKGSKCIEYLRAQQSGISLYYKNPNLKMAMPYGVS